MPASQAASLTPCKGANRGNRVGANGDTAAIFAMTSLQKVVPAGRRAPAPLLLWQGRHPIALDRLFNFSVDVLDLGLAAQFASNLLRLLMDHGCPHAILDLLEGGWGPLSSLINFDNVPAKLGLEGLPDFSHLQAKCRLLELRHHLPTREKAKFSTLILRARILGMFLGKGGKIGAMQDFLVEFARLVFALDQDVARAHLVLSLQGADLAFVKFLGFRLTQRILDALVEIDVAQRSPAPILHAFIETGVGAQLLSLGGIGEELIFDEKLEQDAALGCVG